MFKHSILTTLFILSFFSFSLAQNNPSFRSGDVLLALKKLNTVGSVLYVAAHPDDENTIMLTWLANEKLLKTAYLSINRGDGGQNLIGKEIGEQLGLIRTHELMAARKIDGPEQYFTRATDFGFSKNTQETLEIWNENEILADVVYRIRAQQPDVIICRFPPDQRAGHGNHSASAYLAEKAFKLSGDASQFPEQLHEVKPWQAKRIVWNSFNFAARTQAPTEKEYLTVDLGAYNHLLGQSYAEIAADSRSQHKSQGFGVPRDRGTRLEYLVHKDGVKAQKDIFEDIDQTWARLEGGAEIGSDISKIIESHRVEKPEASIAALVAVYKKIENLKNSFWRQQKLAEVQKIIQQCAGLWLEITADQQQVAQGDSLKVNFNVVNRSAVPMQLGTLTINELGITKNFAAKSLNFNAVERESFAATIAQNKALTQPYWLAMPKKHKGQYQYLNNTFHGEPMAKAAYLGSVSVAILGQNFNFELPLLYKYTDEVKGELYQPFEVKPKISVKPLAKVMLFADTKPKTLSINLKNYSKNTTGVLRLNLPQGWRSNPMSHSFSFQKKNEENTFVFTVIPAANTANEAKIEAVATVAGQDYKQEAILINYDHIPQLALYHPAEIKVINQPIKQTAKNIGYVVGAGDEVPEAISQLGASLSFLSMTDLDANLAKYQTIVMGVRAFNTLDDLRLKLPKLLKYVENGGNLVVQYQVNSFLQQINESFGPYPFKISRERVTVEEAEVRLKEPNHPLLNYPNKITKTDFDGWVQERGLYFSNDWDPRYQTPLSSNDPGEKPLDGGLLHCKYGKGRFTFTGYAFFRQLPAAVPGAYKLWANIISN